MKKKIYTISAIKGDSDWLGMEEVDEIEDADVVLFNGLSDLHPDSYITYSGGNMCTYTYARVERDKEDIKKYEKAVELRKVIIGCNRGLHIIATQLGAGIVQHMQHPLKHRITMYDGSKMNVISYHHQMVSLVKMNAVDYQLIGHAKGLSPIYLNGHNTGFVSQTRDAQQIIIEPEIIHFPSIRGLGFQFNPGEFPEGSESLKICKGLVNRLLDYKLFNAVNLKIPLSLVIDDEFEFNSPDIKLLLKKGEFENV